ncbi:MAG: NAD(+)/NADH kinase [Polyangiales bacterium]
MTGARRDIARVLVVSKKSTYALYVEDAKDPRFLELVRENHPSVARLRVAHEAHERALAHARTVFDKLGVEVTYQVVGGEAAVDADLVVTLGGDGTLLWVSHIVDANVPMVGINTSPGDSVGYFCAATNDAVGDALADAVRGTLPELALTRMRVDLDEQVLTRRVLNDLLFSHRIPAATTRYLLACGGAEEEHKSSGVWVGTAAGSTAAMRSAGGDVLPIDSDELQFVVREPYVGDGSCLRMTKGRIPAGDALEIRSQTPTGAVYFDGPYREHTVPMGAVLRMSRSEEPLHLLGLGTRRAG